MPRTRFVAGKGGTLVFYPPEATIGGEPTAATVTCVRSSGEALPTPVQAAEATIDPVDKVLDVQAEAGSRVLIIADTSGMEPGRKYLVRAADDGELVDVQVVGVSADGAVRLRSGVRRDLPPTSEVLGWALSFVLTPGNTPAPATTAAKQGSPGAAYLFRAEWSYSLGGVAYPPADQLYEVRRRVLRPVVTAGDVQGRVPGTAGDVEIVTDDVAEAWDDVLDGLAAAGVDADRVMNPDRLRLAHLLRTLATAADTWGPTWVEWAEKKREQAQAALEEALEAADWYDTAEDAKQAQGEQHVHFARIVR